MKRRITECICPTCGARFGRSKIYQRYGQTAKSIAARLRLTTDQVYLLERRDQLEKIIAESEKKSQKKS